MCALHALLLKRRRWHLHKRASVSLCYLSDLSKHTVTFSSELEGAESNGHGRELGVEGLEGPIRSPLLVVNDLAEEYHLTARDHGHPFGFCGKKTLIAREVPLQHAAYVGCGLSVIRARPKP